MRSDEVLKRLDKYNLSYRQIDHWVAQEYIKPSDVKGVGYGGRSREWSAAEFVVISNMTLLVYAGVKPEIAAKAARDFLSIEYQNLLNAILSIHGREVQSLPIHRDVPAPRGEDGHE
jgi:hypothetical protein